MKNFLNAVVTISTSMTISGSMAQARLPADCFLHGDMYGPSRHGQYISDLDSLQLLYEPESMGLSGLEVHFGDDEEAIVGVRALLRKHSESGVLPLSVIGSTHGSF